jgi:hypothetical protein
MAIRPPPSNDVRKKFVSGFANTYPETGVIWRRDYCPNKDFPGGKKVLHSWNKDREPSLKGKAQYS